MELLGAAATAGSVALAGVTLLSDIVLLATGGLEEGHGLTLAQQFGLSVVLILLACAVNLLPVKFIGRVLIVSSVTQVRSDTTSVVTWRSSLVSVH